MMQIAVVLALLFSFICGMLAAMHSLQVNRMTLLDWSLLALGGMYGLGWALVVTVTQDGGNLTWAYWINGHESLYSMHTAAALVLTLGVWCGWYVAAAILKYFSRQKSYCYALSLRTLAVAFWLMLVMSIFMQYLYTKVYGGFFDYLDYATAIRSSIFEVSNPFSFLLPFGGLAMISAYGFFGVWLSGRKSISSVLGFAISFAFSLYILYSWVGRMGFLVFLMVFPIGVMLARRRTPLKLLAIALIAFIVILSSAYGVSVWMDIKAAANLTEFLARELSFPFVSFFAQWDGGNLYRGFVDFVVTPIFLLPSSLWMDWIETAGQVNTALIMGAPKGEQGVTGTVPVDLLTLGLMQAHFLGVPIVGVLFGGLIRVLQFWVDRLPYAGIRGVLEAYLALKIAVLGIFYAQPNLVVAGNFAMIVGIIIIALTAIACRVRLVPVVITKREFSAKVS